MARGRNRNRSRSRAGGWLRGRRRSIKPQLTVRSGHGWLPRLKGTVNQLARRLPATQPVIIVIVVVVVIVVVAVVFAVGSAAEIFVGIVIIIVITIMVITVTEPHASTSTFAFVSGSIMCRGLGLMHSR